MDNQPEHRVEQWLDNIEEAKQPGIEEAKQIPAPPNSTTPLDEKHESVSVVSTTSSMRSFKLKDSKVKLELARLARQQDLERKEESKLLAETEEHKRKLLAEAAERERKLQEELADRESRRKLELAEAEARAWEEASIPETRHNEVQTRQYAGSTTPLLEQTTSTEQSRNEITPTAAQPPQRSTLYAPPVVRPKDSALSHLPLTERHLPPFPSDIRVNDEREHVTTQHQNRPSRYADRSPMRNQQRRTQLSPTRIRRDSPLRHVNHQEVGERFLPKPIVQKFNGDPMDYWSFVNRYQLHIADKVDSYDLKLVYLLQHCTEPVCEKIKHNSVDNYENDGYETAMQELFERYGQPHIIARRCESLLQEFPRVPADDPEALEKLAVLLRNCCASLEKARIKSTVDSVGFISTLVNKLPLELRKKWISKSLSIQDKTGAVAVFKDFANFVREQSREANSVYGKCLLLKPTNPVVTTARKPKVSAYNVNVTAESPTAAAPTPKPSGLQCPVCKKPHLIGACRDFKDKSYEQRKRVTRECGLCFKCLKAGHSVRECPHKIKCSVEGCTGNFHHTLLHDPRWIIRPADRIESNTTVKACMHSLSAKKNTVVPTSAYLDIVPVRVRSGGKETRVYALLDSGANRTFCDRRLADQLQATPTGRAANFDLCTMTTSEPINVKTTSVSLTVLPLAGGEELNLPDVALIKEIPATPSKIPERNKLNRYKYLRGVDLPQIPDGEVMLLIGNDNAMAHRCLESRFAPNPRETPDAIRTPLGWLLKGPSLDSLPNEEGAAGFLLQATAGSGSDEAIKDLLINDVGDVFPSSDTAATDDVETLMCWLRSHKEASEFGMKYSKEDVMAYDIMTRRIERVEGHYQLPLPWKDDSTVLPDSLPMARSRLSSLKKRLARDVDFSVKYTKYMTMMLDNGYAEVVPEDEVNTTNKLWYLPHHPVINPKKPSKVRIVYDCAAKCEGQSINDKLMKGPDLVNPLVGVLMRFRRERVAIVSDIEAMFHQVLVAQKDRDALRFLWWPGGDLTKSPVPHRMKVHLFGARSSPCCATFCLRETAREFGKFFHPRVAEVVKNNFYVDDCLVTAVDDQAGIQLVKDLRNLLSMGGFKLTKWLSTSAAVMESVPADDRAKVMQDIPLGGEVHERVLGINWCVQDDEFKFDITIPTKPLTRRGMLSVTNSLFDPLGFVAPVVLEARLIYRDLCLMKTDWDEEVTGTELERWKAWCNSLNELTRIRIPRCFKPQVRHPTPGVQLHVFADASTAARGCVCYLRTTFEDDNTTCSFVMGKSLLCDSGKHTIPRLELEAALDAVKLSRTVKRELGLDDCPCIYWTDSTIVLQSLFSDCKNFPVFSRNRLSQIEAYTSVHDWRHVPTKLNPADQASRGTTAGTMMKTGTWHSGPKFLHRPAKDWPTTFLRPQPTEQIYRSFDLPKPESVFLTATNCSPTDKFIRYFSSLHRLKISTSWILRFCAYLKNKVKKDTAKIPTSPIDAEELRSAESALVRYVQRREFPDWMRMQSTRRPPSTSPIYKLNPILNDGILRVGGRLDNARLDYKARHPAIIPDNCHLTDLLIDHCHSVDAAHSGMNHTLNILFQRYWVQNARVATRRILSRCLLCQRRAARPERQIMADLPPSRLQIDEPPFTHTGVDFFGPLLTKLRRSEVKRYGCLFTCMTTRAIHLEVATDLSTDAFINALRRFTARRGPVTHLYSDNGTNFVGCERILRECIEEWNRNQVGDYLRQKNIIWKFNPPAASHFGGAWERLIRSVKFILQALLQGKPLDDDLLHTLLVEVEDIVNSRPLTQVPLEIGEDLPLTPNHLLKINPTITPPPTVTRSTDCYARRRYRVVQYLADEFWKRWIQEYPRSIISRQKWHEQKDNVAEGDVVLLVDNSAPRGQWPLGRVNTLFHDKHGIVRSVEVKTAAGLMKRPIAKLCVIVSERERSAP